MADYSTSTHVLSHSSGIAVREQTATLCLGVADAAYGSFLRRAAVPFAAVLHRDAYAFVLNRGTNAGSGAAFVYWLSPDNPDPTGVYYNQAVPWGQITDVIWVSTVYPGRSW